MPWFNLLVFLSKTITTASKSGLGGLLSLSPDPTPIISPSFSFSVLLLSVSPETDPAVSSMGTFLPEPRCPWKALRCDGGSSCSVPALGHVLLVVPSQGLVM